MPYATNPGQDMKVHEMSRDEKEKHLWMHLNDIATYLWVGEAWHEKTANECRKIGIRGWGRWHEAESHYDGQERCALNKLMCDKLDYAPDVDMGMVDKAIKYTMSSAADFKVHHQVWLDREEHFILCLNNAIKLSPEFDMELYRKLCCMVDEVQNEAMRVKLVVMRLDLAGWNGHDIGVCSKWLHEYFEKEYSGGVIDINIG